MNKPERHIRKIQTSMNLQIPVSNTKHKQDPHSKPQITVKRHNPRLGSVHGMLTFSKSNDRKIKNKRCTTEPEEFEFLSTSTSKNDEYLKFSNESSKHFEFDKLQFKKKKSEITDKISNVEIRRENSKEFLINLTPKRFDFITPSQNSQRTKLPNSERKSKNMSFIKQPKLNSIFHRKQVTVGTIPRLYFSQKSNKSQSINKQKPKTQKLLSDTFNQNIYAMNPSSINLGYQRKISYLKTQPQVEEQACGLQAQFKQFLKNSHIKMSTQRRKKQKPLTIQFDKTKFIKHKPNVPVIENKKYEYSSFYIQQINNRNKIRALTSRQKMKASEYLPLNSDRSTNDYQPKLLSNNVSKGDIYF